MAEHFCEDRGDRRDHGEANGTIDARLYQGVVDALPELHRVGLEGDHDEGGIGVRAFAQAGGGPSGCSLHSGGCSRDHVIATMRHSASSFTRLRASTPQCDHAPSI